jgi:hypothetical protein
MYPRPPLALLCLLVIASLSASLAQEAGPAASDSAVILRPGTALISNAPKILTGKERLGEKWTDEQRTDNCKVPLDKRGPKPRPDTCPNGAAGLPSKSADLSKVQKQ